MSSIRASTFNLNGSENTKISIDGTKGLDIVLSANAKETVIVTSNGKVGIGTNTVNASANVHIYSPTDAQLRIEGRGEYSDIVFATPNTARFWVGKQDTTIDPLNYIWSEGLTPITIYTNNLERLRVSGDGNVGIGTANTGTVKLNVNGQIYSTTLLDVKGDVRDVIVNNQTTSYGLTANDAGKFISATTGNVFVPNAVFTAGQTVSVYNNSAATITITQNVSTTMYLAGTATTGNRLLAQRGLATVLCVAANTFVVSGAGIT